MEVGGAHGGGRVWLPLAVDEGVEEGLQGVDDGHDVPDGDQEAFGQGMPHGPEGDAADEVGQPADVEYQVDHQELPLEGGVDGLFGG